MKKGNVYVLIDPITCKTRYIGSTTLTVEQRLWKHLEDALYGYKSRSRNMDKVNWINSLLKKGRLPIVKKLATVETWGKSLHLEKWLTEKYKENRNLTNKQRYLDGKLQVCQTEAERKLASEKSKRYYELGGKAYASIKIKYFNMKGEFLGTFETIGEASKYLNISEHHISRVVRKLKPQVKGYIFRKVEDDELVNPIEFDPFWGVKKRVKVTNLLTNITILIESIKATSEYLNIPYNTFFYHIKKGKTVFNNHKIEYDTI